MKAIVFDCFGVLAENGWGLIDDKLKPTQAQWDQMIGLSHACDRGIISIESLVEGFAESLQVPPEEVKKIITSQRKNYPLLNYIKDELKPHYKIAMLSNVGSGFIQGYFNEQELELFDQLILSSDEGIAKPDPTIYKLTATRLGVNISQCLFIDDAEQNVVAAEQTGMKGHLYKGLTDLKKTLSLASEER